ncbi:hypothetical protein ACIBAC_42210 [Streptomyces sp. NPDC051362]|uniref:hypothetical protein n=1 Tax=Streptomyces sp. NPDC051362 TaxID=3365651 RepID=UPI00378848CB
MRVLFFSNPIPGRLLPLLPLARALRDQGHDVAISTAAEVQDWISLDDFELLLYGPGTDELTVEVARRFGTDILFTSDLDLTAELFAGARVDLATDSALIQTGDWAPDLIVSEHLDLVGPLIANALEVPCALALTGSALDGNTLEALVTTVRSRYIDRGLRPPSLASARWWLRYNLDPDPRSQMQTSHSGIQPKVLVAFDPGADASTNLGSYLETLSALDMYTVTPDTTDVGSRQSSAAVESLSPIPGPESITPVLDDGDLDVSHTERSCEVPAAVASQSEQTWYVQRMKEASPCVALAGETRNAGNTATNTGAVPRDEWYSGTEKRFCNQVAAVPTAADVARWLASTISRT